MKQGISTIVKTARHLAAVLSLFAVGCVSHELTLNNATSGVVVVQVQTPSVVQVQPVNSTSIPHAPGFSLAELVIKEGKASLDERDVLSRVPPVNFQGELEGALSNALPANYDVAGVSTESAKLFLSSEFFLSPRCHALIIETRLILYKPRQLYPILSSSLVYQSEGFWAQTCQEWSKEDAELYDTFVKEGTAEIARMAALVMSGATIESAKGREELSFESLIGYREAREVTMLGETIEQGDSRTLFRTRSGSFYSLANTDIR